MNGKVTYRDTENLKEPLIKEDIPNDSNNKKGQDGADTNSKSLERNASNSSLDNINNYNNTDSSNNNKCNDSDNLIEKIKKKEQRYVKKLGSENKDSYKSSNILSKIFYYWAFKIVKLANNVNLKKEHIGTPSEDHKSDVYLDEIKKIWYNKKYRNIKSRALCCTVVRANILNLIAMIILSIVVVSVEYVSVLLFSMYISSFEDDNSKRPTIDAYKVAILFFLCKLFVEIFKRYVNQQQSIIGIKSGFQLNNFIYEKVLNVSPASRLPKYNEGQIVSLMQVDANKLSASITNTPTLFTAPLQLIVYSYRLYEFFGISATFGLSVLLIFFIINYFMYRKYQLYFRITSKNRDKRMSITSETFGNLKLLKLYSWEQEYLKRIEDTRAEELRIYRKVFNLTIWNIGSSFLSPAVVSLATFAGYYHFSKAMDINNIMSGLYVFTIISSAIRQLPLSLNSIVECFVSMERVEKFIRQEDIILDNTTDKINNIEVLKKNTSESTNNDIDKLDNINSDTMSNKSLDISETILKIDNISFSWGVEKDPSNVNTKNIIKDKDLNKNNKETVIEPDVKSTSNNYQINKNETKELNSIEQSVIDDNNINKKLSKLSLDYKSKINDANIDYPIEEGLPTTLKNIKITVNKGEFVGIIGDVGCGKSSLLQAILNNMIILNNSQNINEAYKIKQNNNKDKDINDNKIIATTDSLQTIENKSTYSNNNNNNNCLEECSFKKKIYLKGSVSYVPQIPWVQNATIKDNIVFNHEYKKEKYDRVVDLCELKSDFDSLIGGDLTEIGEKGINLSGGQKARVSLARAIYADSDILLLDDPISALDAHVGHNIMTNLILSDLKGKTRILATHALQYISNCDKIIYMNDGRIEWSGVYNDLLDQPFFSIFIQKLEKDKALNKEHKSNDLSEENEVIGNNNKTVLEGIQELPNEHGSADGDSLLKNKSEEFDSKDNNKNAVNNNNEEITNKNNQTININHISNHENDKAFFKKMSTIPVNTVIFNDQKNKQNVIKRITKEEDKEVGHVSLKVYHKYIIYTGGYFLFICVLIVMILWQSLKALSDIWILYWQDHQKDLSTKENWIKIFIYGGLGLSSSVFAFLRVTLLTYCNLKNSKRIHTEMATSLVNAPINLFHDTTPKGIILNRLSKDLIQLDIMAMFTVGTFIWSLMAFLGIIVVCSIYSIYSIIFLPILAIPGYLITNYYTNCSREITRLEGISRSPIVNLLAEAVLGSITIRAYNQIGNFKKKFHQKVDTCFQINLYRAGAANWFGLVMGLLALLFLGFLLLFTSIFKHSFGVGAISIMLNYTMQLQQMLFDMLTTLSSMENIMVSMERCLNFTNIPKEKPLELDSDKHLDTNWPSKGNIKFVNYSVKYRPDTEIVLNKINFELKAGERLGVVGRTGSGKSTLCLSLFRILEPLKGTIYIDDVDICNVGLSKLRSGLTIIPQDPSLMKGSLKYNIDPLQKFTDKTVIDVMKSVGLYYILEHNKEGLNQEIAESGTNLSVGEKQLICICRALLRVNIISYLNNIINLEIKNNCNG